MKEAGHIQIVMPQMGESLAEGTIVRWLKSAGDRIARDESLFEISTDKVDTDVPAPAAGVLTAILAREGETVAVGAPVAIIAIEPTAEAAAPAAPATSGPAPPTAPPAEEPGGHFKASHAPQVVSFRRERGDANRAGTPQAPPASPRSAAAADGPPNRTYTAAVLETARQRGVPLEALTALKGSGRGGRITKRDVQRFIDEGGAAWLGATRASPAAQPASDSAPREGIPPEYLYRPTAEDRLEPMSPVRRRVAHHMTWSTRISAHATAQGEVDMRAVAALLAKRDDFRDRFEAPLTYTVVVAAAAVSALRDFPVLNSSVVGDQIAFKRHVHLGIAVALPDSDELIVPVIRHADDLGLVGLARAVDDLATRARDRRLAPPDVQGGTFTLTNPGVFGGITGTPILNQPQVAILGLGAVRKLPVVIDDAIAIRPIMALALTFDHRATDGMVAFRYLARVRELLEHPPDDWRWTT